MAQQMLNLGGNLPPEILQQQQALTRQQQLANLLTQQGLQQPQGQMVSGRFVAPSFFQYAAPLAQLYAGQKMAEKGDKAQADLAKALRQQYANEAQQYQDLLRGKEATYGADIPTETYETVKGSMISPATQANPQAAYLFGSTAYNPALQQVALKKLTEGPQWKEASKLDAQGNTISGYVDMNSSNPEATFRPFAMTKTALSPADIIRFRDEGIAIPSQFTGQSQPSGQTVTTPQGQPSGQPTVAPTSAPTVASAQSNNPFVAPPVPSNLTGKQAREWKAEQAKPLTGKPLDEINGAIGYQKSLNKIQDLFNKYQGPQLLDPNVRAEFKDAVRTAQLIGKEAYGLGVLNGPDLGILEQVITDPTAFDSFLKDRNTINKIYNNQKMFTAEKIKTNYVSAQKAVPQNLREFVEIKPRELDSNKPKDSNVDMQTKLRSLGIPYQPKLYEYRVNPDGSVDRKRKIL